MPNFDTHKFVKSFVSAKTDEEKAEAIVHVITEAKSEAKIEFEETKKDFDSRIDLLATKSDLNFSEERLRSEMKSLETKLTIRIGTIVAFSTALILGLLPLMLHQN